MVFSVALLLLSSCSRVPSANKNSGNNIDELIERAEAGDPEAQNDLASRYQEGEGVSKDLVKSLALYQKAAASGEPIPQSNLGFMYDMGLGTAQNRQLANEWYSKSAEQGYAPAMLNLGLNIAGGQGAPQDLVEGMKWVDLARLFSQSEKNMHVKWGIRGAYDDLKNRLSMQQLDEAQRRSQEWYKVFKANAENKRQ
jgi:TPR repeat protein